MTPPPANQRQAQSRRGAVDRVTVDASRTSSASRAPFASCCCAQCHPASATTRPAPPLPPDRRVSTSRAMPAAPPPPPSPPVPPGKSVGKPPRCHATSSPTPDAMRPARVPPRCHATSSPTPDTMRPARVPPRPAGPRPLRTSMPRHRTPTRQPNPTKTNPAERDVLD